MFAKRIGLLPLLGMLALLSAADAHSAAQKSAPVKSSAAAAALSTRYVWHDTEGEHAVWLNPALVAEFNNRPQSASTVKRVHPAAMAEPGSRGKARIWRLDDAERVLQQVRTANPAGMYSPVFNDGPVDGARKRALPGGVIVYFKPEWTGLQISAWIASQGLSSGQKLAIGPNVYVLKTAPGLAALETANHIYQSGDVVSAEPNWWVEARTR